MNSSVAREAAELIRGLRGRPSRTTTLNSGRYWPRKAGMRSIFATVLLATAAGFIKQGSSSPQLGFHNGFQLYSPSANPLLTSNQSNASSAGQQQVATSTTTTESITNSNSSASICSNGLLTFELSTGFIYKPSSAETLAMMPSTLQLTDCLDYCLQNASCLAINFEMGLCVLLSSSAKQNPTNLYSSQFPVFTIYAEKKCLLSGDPLAPKQRRRCQRAWTFERVAGYEMKTRPRKRLKFASKEHCMEACLVERDFECRSANWFRQTGECTLSDQDRHSVSQSEAGDQQLKLQDLYGPSNLSLASSQAATLLRPALVPSLSDSLPGSLYQNYYMAGPAERSRNLTGNSSAWQGAGEKSGRQMGAGSSPEASNKYRQIRQLEKEIHRLKVLPRSLRNENQLEPIGRQDWLQYVDMPANALVDYLENNCIYEPNKLCEFRKIQNRVLKTVDSIYQDVLSLDECKQKCLNAPYRCYSFDYGDTSERVCRTSHLDQASLLSVKEPYLDVVGAITYELASCFNVSIQCKAREMVALVSSSKTFKGKIYVKSRPSSCVNDVRESLQFELTMRYHDENCDVRSSSNSKQGVFSNDIVIQHHDRIVTTQDVGLSVYCQYDLGNRSITNNVDLAIERLDESIESKTHPSGSSAPSSGSSAPAGSRPSANSESGSIHSPLTITSLATTVVRSPNVTMRITNMNGQPVTSATVGDRLALLFEIKEKSSPFGIFVREIIAMDGLQLLQQQQALNNNNATKVANNGARIPGKGAALYHYAAASGANLTTTPSSVLVGENSLESFQANKANSIQFIDSQGCPTDSNIMGPLVRMDPAGHRILAPFDAFKFPTSDMVFFRAVVSSCISDCKPVLCPPGDASSAVTFNPQLAGGVTNPDGPHHHLGSTSRNMPTRLPSGGHDAGAAALLRHTSAAAPFEEATKRPPPSSSTGSGTAPNSAANTDFEYVTTLATQLASSMSPQHLTVTPSAAQSASTLERWNGSGSPPLVDSFELSRNRTGQSNRTAVSTPPTLSGELQKLPADSLTTVPGFGPAALDASGWPGSLDSNQIGAPGQDNRPPVVNMTNNHFGKAPPRPTMASLQLANEKPIDLDSMSVQQKRQLIQLFESKLEQINKQGSVSSSSNNNSRLHMSDMADFLALTLNEFAQNGSTKFEEQMKADQKIEGKFAILLSLINALDLLNQSANQLVEQSQKSAKPSILAQLERDVLANQSSSSLSEAAASQQGQQLADSSNDLETSGSNLNTALNFTFNAEQTFERPNSSKPPTRSQQQAAGSGNRAAKPAAATKVTKQEAQQQQIRRKTRDKSQAFADAYLGALQSSGGRPRRRRKRRRREANLEPNGSSLGAGYVYLEQPQSTVAPSEAARDHHRDEQPLRFTKAVVEMYHTSTRGRRKREAQPFYDVDELIVQSIKILDRMPAEEEQRRAREAASRRSGAKQSLPRSLLVTHPAARHQHRNSSATEPTSEARLEEVFAQQRQSTSWTGSGALSLLLVALTLIFVQLFLVLVCLLDWGRSKKKSPPTTMFARTEVRGGRGRAQQQQLLVDHYASYSNACASSPSSVCSATSRRSSRTPGSADLSYQRRANLQRYQHQHQQYRKPAFGAGRSPTVLGEELRRSHYLGEESATDRERALNEIRCIACLLPNHSNNQHTISDD